MPPDRELLAAIGEVVVDAAALEYFIAVLVAVIEGRDEEWARKQVAQTGAASGPWSVWSTGDRTGRTSAGCARTRR
jgi:hypothetical protein